MARFAANLGFLWPDRPLLERIDAAAAAGFRAIELHWPYDTSASDVGSACAHHGLTLLGINTHRGRSDVGEFGTGALAGREEEFQRGVDQSIDYCALSGASAIHAMAGNVAAVQRVAARAVFLSNLRLAADKAARFGLTLLLEPLNQRDQPHYFYARLAEAAELIAQASKSNIKLQFDVYHVGIAEGDILRKLAQYLPIIGHVQIAAVPSRAEPDEGEIAYRAVFEQLDSLGYAGWVGCEYRPRAGTDAGLGWLQKLGVSLAPREVR